MNARSTLITLIQAFEANEAWLPSMFDRGPVLLPGLRATGGPGLPIFWLPRWEPCPVAPVKTHMYIYICIYIYIYAYVYIYIYIFMHVLYMYKR